MFSKVAIIAGSLSFSIFANATSTLHCYQADQDLSGTSLPSKFCVNSLQKQQDQVVLSGPDFELKSDVVVIADYDAQRLKATFSFSDSGVCEERAISTLDLRFQDFDSAENVNWDAIKIEGRYRTLGAVCRALVDTGLVTYVEVSSK